MALPWMRALLRPVGVPMRLMRAVEYACDGNDALRAECLQAQPEPMRAGATGTYAAYTFPLLDAMTILIVVGAITILIGLFDWPYGRWSVPLIMVGVFLVMFGAVNV